MCIWRNPRRETAIAKAQRWKRSVHLRQQGRKETGKVCAGQRSNRWTHSNWTHTGHCMNWTWTLGCLSKTGFPTFLTLVSFLIFILYFPILFNLLPHSLSSPVFPRLLPFYCHFFCNLQVDSPHKHWSLIHSQSSDSVLNMMHSIPSHLIQLLQ